jgi:hypothetical protein
VCASEETGRARLLVREARADARVSNQTQEEGQQQLLQGPCCGSAATRIAGQDACFLVTLSLRPLLTTVGMDPRLAQATSLGPGPAAPAAGDTRAERIQINYAMWHADRYPILKQERHRDHDN